MTAIRRTAVLGLAVLLAVPTAAADTVITADEVIPCWDVEPAGSDSVSFTLPRRERETLSIFEIYEVRLADSSRVVELATQLPRLRVVLDAGQPVPAPAVRAREMLSFPEGQSRRPTGQTGVLDTLYLPTTPEKMMARCWEMDTLLRKYERYDTAVVSLLREVRNEQAALRGIWPSERARLISGAGGVLGMVVGTWIGLAEGPPQCVPPLPYTAPGTGSTECGYTPGTCVVGGAPVGCIVGSVTGYVLGAGVGRYVRVASLEVHRNRVRELARKVNRAVAAALPKAEGEQSENEQ